jgi:hypothetical protein
MTAKELKEICRNHLLKCGVDKSDIAAIICGYSLLVMLEQCAYYHFLNNCKETLKSEEIRKQLQYYHKNHCLDLKD